MTQQHTQHANFFSTAQSLFCVVGFEGSFRQLNAACAAQWGYDIEELLHSGFLDLFHPEEQTRAEAWLDELSQSDAPLNLHARLRHKDGEYHEYLWQATPSPMEFAFYAVAIEIGGFRAKIEEETYRQSRDDYAILQEKYDDLQIMYEELQELGSHNPHQPLDYNLLIGTLQEAVLVRYQDGRIEALNQSRVNEVFDGGLKPEEFELLWQAAHTEQQAANDEEKPPGQLYHTSIRYSKDKQKQPSSKLRPVHYSLRRLGKEKMRLSICTHSLYKDDSEEPYAQVLVVHDISEQHQLKDSLHHLQEDVSLVTQNQHEGILDWELRGQKARFSAGWRQLLGYDRERLGDRIDAWHSRVHPADHGPLLSTLKNYLQAGKNGAPFDHTHRLQHHDGTYRWVRAQGDAIRDRQGRALRLILTFTDVTEQHRLESALQAAAEAEKHLRFKTAEYETIFNAAPLMIIYKDAHSRIIRVNQFAADWLGHSKEELRGISEKKLKLGYTEQYYADDTEVIRSGQAKRGILEVSRGHYFLTDKFPYRDMEGKVIGVIVFAIDISAQIKAQEKCEHNTREMKNAIRDFPIMIAALDHEGGFALWNHECERVTGHREETLKQHPDPFLLLYPEPEDYQEAKQHLQHIIEEDPGIYTWQRRIQCRQGGYKNIVWSVNTQLKIPGYSTWAVGHEE